MEDATSATPLTPRVIRARLRRIAQEVEELTDRAQAGVIDGVQFSAELRRLGEARDALDDQLPPPAPTGARIFAAVRAFCDAYLTYAEPR